MSRADTERDIQNTLGLVPTFLKAIPDNLIDQEWHIMKTFVLADTALSAKTKALLGITAAASLRCYY